MIVMANSQLLTLANKLTNKWLNRLAPLLLLLAIVWLCWNIARILWLFLAPPQAPSLPVLPMQTSNSNQNIQTNAQSFTIFESPDNAPKQPTIEQAPSNIQLKGVMTAIPISDSSALISVNGKIQNYRIGKQLEGTNYTLESVSWNEITLINPQNAMTTVKMLDPLNLNQEFIPKDGYRSSNSNNQANQANNETTRNFTKQTNSYTQNKAPKPTNNPNGRKPTSNRTANNNTTSNSVNNDVDNIDSPVDNNIKSVEQTLEDIKQNPKKYLTQMGVQSGGDGYTITHAMPAGIRQRTGLQIGDKILTLNGQKVGNNPAQDAHLLQQIQKTGQANIQVQRGERVFTFNSSF